MRKIIIDDNIRNFASEYSSKVQAKCPNVITDLKKLRDNVISFNPQIDQSIVKNYIIGISKSTKKFFKKIQIYYPKK